MSRSVVAEMSRMCLYNRFTTFCQRSLNWNKSRVWAWIKLCYFPFAVAIFLSKICLCDVLWNFMKWMAKGQHHIHNIRSRCFTKKSAFKVTGNLVKRRNSRSKAYLETLAKIQDTPAREESLELYSFLWSEWPTSKQKSFTSQKWFGHSG